MKTKKGGRRWGLARRGSPWLGLAGLMLVGTYAGCGEAPESSVVHDEYMQDQRVPEGVWEGLREGIPQELILVMYDDGVEDTVRASQAKAGMGQDYDDYIRRKQSIYAQRKAQLLASMPTDSGFLLQDFPRLPMAVVEINSPAGLEAILTNLDVKSLHKEEILHANLAQSLGVINQPAVSAVSGKTGEGTAVAVLDTGVNYTHSAFGSCSSPGGDCKVAFAIDTAPNDGKLDADGHGTNVAGIVVGVAPDTKIISMDVFQGAGASSTDIIEAIDWVLANKATYNIVAMNMSLGGGSYTAQCPSSVFATPIANARSAGVLSAIATGNDGFTNKVAAPACVPEAVSVGATYDANYGKITWSGCTDNKTYVDKVTCFSNATTWITMLAPGALIEAAGLTQGGTSQASPHVAGAIAVLRGAFLGDSVTETVSRLTDNGVTVQDIRTGLDHKRLDLQASAAGEPTTPTPTPTPVTTPTPEPTPTPTAPPTPSPTLGPGANRVSINNADTYANNINVNLTFSREDDSLTQMCVSNATTCHDWQGYRSSLSWELSAGNGTATVYTWFRDDNLEVSNRTKDTIYLDLSPATNGSATAVPGDGEVEISWEGFSDQQSGLASYRLVFGTSDVPSSCNRGTLAYAGEDLSFTHSGLVNGNTYYYRLCGVDNAGNHSSGVLLTARPATEFDAPVGTIVINSDDDYTNNSQVTLTLDATDDNSVTQVCLSNGNSCTNYLTYNTSRSWTLNSGDGNRTVYAWFKDEFGNESSSPVTDTIYQDKTLPRDGTLSGTAGNGQIALAWTGFSDRESGLASYKVVFGYSSMPNHCNHGNIAYEGTATSYTHTGITNGETYYYRVCAIDNAGNQSLGAIREVQPSPEFDAPTGGSVSINSGDTYTNSNNVSLTLAATDASEVGEVCVSNSNSCDTWQAMASTLNWTVQGTNTTATVSVWFRDIYGNETTTAATDTIYIDGALPRNGSGSATPGNAQLALAWTGFSDGESGVASYEVVYSLGSAPADCTRGSSAYSGANTSYTHTGLTNGETYFYRVCAVDNAGNMSTGSTFQGQPTPEGSAPSATSVTINGGDTDARSSAVTLTLSATDASGISDMCISNTTSCSGWIPYNTSKNWTLSAGEGTKTVYVWYRDIYGNATTSPVSDSIDIDLSAPGNGTISVTESSGQVDLTWTGFTDTRSGIDFYTLVFSTSSTPSDCVRGTLAYQGTGTSFSHTGITDGRTYYYRLCATDMAGNTSGGSAAEATPMPESAAPTGGSVDINGGDVWTSSQKVTLTLTAADAAGIAEVCISNGTTCVSWVPYSPSKTWTLNSGNGTRTVSVWFRDSWGNETTTAATDSIEQDLTKPKDGTLTAVSGAGQVVFNWSGFSDKESGMSHYRLVSGRRAYPSTCSKGQLNYEGPLTTYTHVMNSGTTRYFRLCAVDVAGNYSAGAWASGRAN